MLRLKDGEILQSSAAPYGGSLHVVNLRSAQAYETKKLWIIL